MNAKKSLEKRVRGWFPQEPVLKAPLKVQIAPVNSLNFKVRRWLHGTSAFIRSLWCQRSQRFKIDAVLFGVMVFVSFFMSFLVTTLVSFYWIPFGLFILPIIYFTLHWLISLHFKRKEPYKKHPYENLNPNLRLGGTIIGVIAGAILVYSYYLTLFVYSTLENPSTIPFYLDLVGLFVFLLGWGLYMLWRKRNKLSPFKT